MYELVNPIRSKRRSAWLNYERTCALQESYDRLDHSQTASIRATAITHELMFEETGVQKPVFINGKWLVCRGVHWVEVDSPLEKDHNR